MNFTQNLPKNLNFELIHKNSTFTGSKMSINYCQQSSFNIQKSFKSFLWNFSGQNSFFWVYECTILKKIVSFFKTVISFMKNTNGCFFSNEYMLKKRRRTIKITFITEKTHWKKRLQ